MKPKRATGSFHWNSARDSVTPLRVLLLEFSWGRSCELLGTGGRERAFLRPGSVKSVLEAVR